MASISRDSKGRKIVQFVAGNGKRRSIRLGKMTQNAAEKVKLKVEALNAAAISGCPLDNETAAWLAKIGADLADKLAAVGLIGKRRVALLGEFLAEYISSRKDHKPNTTRNCKAAERSLIEFFGKDKPLNAINPGDADEFALHLRSGGLASTTAGRRIKWARSFFRVALRKKLIAENPFGDVKIPNQVNEARKHFVTLETIEKAIDACPDAEWRLIVALSRFGGVRCPSETLALKLEDVNWERERITIHSPKTEHLPGGESRIIPLFSELKPYLEEVFELAKPGQVYLVNRYRDAKQNLRTQLLRIIKRAGEKPWPRLFHNLRASRQTELSETFPVHVVCDWLGNSEAIADKHYLTVTEDHFKTAVQRAAKSGAVTSAAARNEPQTTGTPNEKTGHFRPVASVGVGCEYLHNNQVLPRGVEPLS